MKIKNLVIPVFLVCSFSCASIGNRKTTFFKSPDPDCRSSAVNFQENYGLWGEEDSFKKTLTPKQWGRFKEKVENSNLLDYCKENVLRTAQEPQVRGPIPLSFVLLVTDFYLEELKNK